MHQSFTFTYITQLTINFRLGNVYSKMGGQQYLLAQSLNIIQVTFLLEAPKSGVWL